jgi:MFS family permease
MRVTDRIRSIDTAKPFPWRFLAPLLIGSALNPINSSVIATAMVPVATAMHSSVGHTTVLISALYVATAIGQPTAGKLAEQFGPRRVLVVGIVAVLAGGVFGGLSNNLFALVVARVLIGVGTSSAYPSSMLLIGRRAERAGMDAPPGRVLGGLVIAVMVTAAAGLPIGGVLVDVWGWRAVFLINIPVGVLALVMTLAWIPAEPRRTAARTLRQTAASIDLPGIAGFGGALAALLVFLLSLPRPAWIALASAIVIGVGLVWWELQARSPFIDVHLLTTHTALNRTYLRFAVTTMCIYTVLYGVTQWLEAARGISASSAGLLLLPMAGLAAALALPVAARNLVRAPLIAAGVSCLVGSFGVLLVTTTTPVIWIVLVTTVFGITLATTTTANQTALYTEVSADQLGTASGLLRSFGYVGSIASAALISVVFHATVDDHGLHVIAWIMVGVSAIGLIALAADPAVVPNRIARKLLRRNGKGSGLPVPRTLDQAGQR